MTVVQTVGRPGVQASLANEADHRRQIAQAVNRLNQGAMNVTLIVTLDAGATSTPVVDARISIQTCDIFSPRTANAAAALASTYAVPTNGSLVVYHGSNGQTDRTYAMGLIG